MTTNTEALASFLVEPTKLGQEVSMTGKWISKKKGGLFRQSAETKEMLKVLEDIHHSAKDYAGILSTEINHVVGEEAILIHQVFKNPELLSQYFSNTVKSFATTLKTNTRQFTDNLEVTLIPNLPPGQDMLWKVYVFLDN